MHCLISHRRPCAPRVFTLRALTPPILKKGIGNESHLSLLYCFPFKHLGTPKKAFCCSREIHRTEVPFSDPMLKAGRVYQAALLAFCS